MTVQDAIKEFWIGFADYKDSSPRSEFYPNVLLIFFVDLLISLMNYSVGLMALIIVVIPFITLCIRRTHDVGYSGWTLLWILIPIVGLVMDIAILTGHEKKKDNKYFAPDPIWQTYIINNKH